MVKKVSSTGDQMESIPKDWTPTGKMPENDEEY